VNEEINTVNTQLQHKVGELEVANSDLRISSRPKR